MHSRQYCKISDATNVTKHSISSSVAVSCECRICRYSPARAFIHCLEMRGRCKLRSSHSLLLIVSESAMLYQCGLNLYRMGGGGARVSGCSAARAALPSLGCGSVRFVHLGRLQAGSATPIPNASSDSGAPTPDRRRCNRMVRRNGRLRNHWGHARRRSWWRQLRLEAEHRGGNGGVCARRCCNHLDRNVATSPCLYVKMGRVSPRTFVVCDVLPSSLKAKYPTLIKLPFAMASFFEELFLALGKVSRNAVEISETFLGSTSSPTSLYRTRLAVAQTRESSNDGPGEPRGGNSFSAPSSGRAADTGRGAGTSNAATCACATPSKRAADLPQTRLASTVKSTPPRKAVDALGIAGSALVWVCWPRWISLSESQTNCDAKGRASVQTPYVLASWATRPKSKESM